MSASHPFAGDRVDRRDDEEPETDPEKEEVSHAIAPRRSRRKWLSLASSFHAELVWRA
jgi:hypothetical protein